jgi:hypothetical protein
MGRVMILLSIGCCTMAAVICYGLLVGDLWGEAQILLAYPWFHVSMIDLYTGFLLFGGWIVFRERSLMIAAIWIVLLLTLGNLASCAYALIAALRARGDWRAFWLGSRVAQTQNARSHDVLPP